MNREEYLKRAVEFARRGNELGHAKLTPELVKAIREPGRTAKQWSLELGLHVRTIEAVRSYKTWRHI